MDMDNAIVKQNMIPWSLWRKLAENSQTDNYIIYNH